MRHAFRLPARSVRAAALAAGAALWLAGAPARAEMPRDQEERGFYLALGGLRERVSNLDFRLASNTAGGKGVRLEFDRGGEAVYQVGWLLPGRRGSVAITYWEYGETETAHEELGTASFAPSGFLDAVANRGQVDAGAIVLARSVDIGYGRDFRSSERFRASWSLGLRYARYEHRLEAEYLDTGGALNDRALEEVESAGVGPRVGASFEYGFNRRWLLAGGVGFATLFGSTDHSNVSTTAIGTPSVATAFNEERGRSRTFDQVDLDLRVLFLAWRSLQVSGGYRVSHWYDARTRERFDGAFEVERVTFDGPYLNVGYRF